MRPSCWLGRRVWVGGEAEEMQEGLLSSLGVFSVNRISSILAVHWQFGILIFPVFGRFSAKLGTKTPLERRGSFARSTRIVTAPAQTAHTHPPYRSASENPARRDGLL